MKKLFCVLLVLALVVSFVGCQKTTSEDKTQDKKEVAIEPSSEGVVEESVAGPLADFELASLEKSGFECVYKTEAVMYFRDTTTDTMYMLWQHGYGYGRVFTAMTDTNGPLTYTNWLSYQK